MQNQPETILVVDDEDVGLELLTDILLHANYSVLQAEDGLIALKLLRQHKIDLIIADIMMPKMNGYQLLERVRQNPVWLHIPILFISARTLDSDIRYGKELGADDYLTKPFHMQDLLAIVRGKLLRAQQLREQLDSSTRVMTNTVLEFDKLQINKSTRQVVFNGKDVQLSAREFTLLVQLTDTPGTVVSPLRLVEATHQLLVEREEASNLIRPLIRNLRHKLSARNVEVSWHIRTIRGEGYCFVP